MKKQVLQFLPALALVTGSFVFTSCDKEDENTVADREFSDGVFVTNEGQFQKSNGDISFFSKITKEVEASQFSTINGRPVGDVVQSMTFNDKEAYILVNNSAKIEIVNASTFKSTGVINGLKLPRYMVAGEHKAYVSSWVKADFVNRTIGEIAVIDLHTNTIVNTIQVGWLPERIAISNNKLFVTNSNENTVSVINLSSETVENTITVGDSPNSLALDANGKLWVLGAGNYLASSPSKLQRINPANNTVEATVTFPFGGAEDLIVNSTRSTMFFNFGGQVYQMGINETALPATALINRFFYGLGIDPETQNIYGADAGTFDSNGKVIRYTPTGQVIDSFNVGVIPNDFYFR